MLAFNFYKIRTGLDIRPVSQGGDPESQARYDQLLQTIGQRAEIEYTAERVFEHEEVPSDLGAYKKKTKIYIFIFGIDKTRSSWTAHLLNLAFGNMYLSGPIINANPDAQEWIGGLENNISCGAALFDLRPKKKRKRINKQNT